MYLNQAEVIKLKALEVTMGIALAFTGMKETKDIDELWQHPKRNPPLSKG